MKASLNSTSDTPWCAYYNNETREWQEDGLLVAAVSPATLGEEEEGEALEADISCLSYHLSDFAVSATDSDGVFAPVELVRVCPNGVARLLAQYESCTAPSIAITISTNT